MHLERGKIGDFPVKVKIMLQGKSPPPYSPKYYEILQVGGGGGMKIGLTYSALGQSVWLSESSLF